VCALPTMASQQQRLAKLRAHLTSPASHGHCWWLNGCTAVGSADDRFGAAAAAHPLTWTDVFDAFPLAYRDGPLTPQQWHEFWVDGFTVARASPGVVDYGGLHGIISQSVEANARLLSERGELKQLFSESGVFRRQAQIEEVVPGSSVALSGKAAAAVMFSDEMRRAVGHPSMLAIARQLTGAPELIIPSNYALRCKGPSAPSLAAGMQDSGTVPWVCVLLLVSNLPSFFQLSRPARTVDGRHAV
jgi:hypothetical protein